MCTGLALCYRCPIGIRLSRCFMKMLTGRVPFLSDYAQVDPQVCNGLRVIASASQQQLADMQLTFEPPDGSAFSIPHGERFLPALALQTQFTVTKAACHALSSDGLGFLHTSVMHSHDALFGMVACAAADKLLQQTQSYAGRRYGS